MTANQPLVQSHLHKFKTINRHKKIVPTFVLLLGATSLSGLPNASMADEVMVNIAGEWATGASEAKVVSTDGSVIAGSANDGTANRAFRWDATNGMVNLADTDGDGVVGTPGSGEWATGYTDVSALSSDGSVIAGHSDFKAFRWDATNGMVNIAGLWANSSSARAISSDGYVIVGQASDGIETRAFRWDATNGMVNIAGEWATGTSSAAAISSDGSVVAGYGREVGAARSYSRAFRWDATNGMVNIAGDWATGNSSAEVMSSDGSIIAGYASDGSTMYAFRWDATTGMVNLADTDGDGVVGTPDSGEWATGTSTALAISSDGSVIAGQAESSGGAPQAFRWDATNGMVNIADTNGDGVVGIPGSGEWADGFSTTSAISSDGSVIVGYGASLGGATRAFRWDATNGMVNIADTDGDGTIDGSASEWAIGLASATAISPDGSILVGRADDGSQWRAFIYRSATSTSESTSGSESSSGGVMLDAVNTQTSIVQNASAQGAAVASVNSSISAIVQTEIEVAPPVRLNFFADPESKNKLPTAINIMASRSSNKNASNVSIGSITAAVALPNELTVGGFAALGTDGTSLSGFGFDGTLKAFGGFVRGASLGNTNLSWKASIATSGGDVKIARDSSLTGTEAASGNSKLTSKSASFEVSYKTLLSGQAVSPYLRLTRAITTRDAYTEQADSFPIAYSENKQTATTATVGIKMQTKLPSNIALRYGLGVDFDLARSDAAIEGTSQIPGMTSISVAAPAVQNKARLLLKSGLTKFYYDGSSMSFDLGVQQNTYSSGTTVIGSVGYTIQF